MEVVAAVAASLQSTILLLEKTRRYLERRGISEANDSVDELKKMLTTFQSYLSTDEQGNISPQGRCRMVEDFANNIQDLVFEIEDALDEFMYDVAHHEDGSSKIRKPLLEFGHKIRTPGAVKRLSGRRKEIENKMKSVVELRNNLRGGGHVSRGGSSSRTAGGDFPTNQSFGNLDDMVGFKKRRIDLVKQLIEGEEERATVLVVGPGGSGKTFLVNNVFQGPEIKQRFACRAWIVVPRGFKVEELLLEVLKNSCSRSVVEGILDQAGSIGEKLHRYLEDKRYLIVLDDIWKNQDYESISAFLPSCLRSSRIIVTTRNSDAVDSPDYVHKLGGLTKKEAWDLFCREIFSKRRSLDSGTFPNELEDLSKRIMERCDRLPLVIVSVARLLSKKQQIYTEWNNFLNNIGSEIKSSNDTALVDRILKPSFVDLSDNLRSCFLYFCMFPEGHSVTRGRLVRSWIAEGFVQETRGKTSEEVAETYLNDLIGRSLVQVGTPETDGRVKTFKVLRLHHEFMVHELYGGKRNLFSVIDESTTSSSDEKFRHLSVRRVDVAAKLSKIKDPSRIRTLFAFDQQQGSGKDGLFHSMRKKIQGSDDSKLENVFHNFKLLKVLDLQRMPLHEFPKHIDSFVLLRRLNLQSTKITTIPRSIKKLKFLESLDLKYSMITELPKRMRKLQKLYHLLVSNVSSGFENGVEINFGIDALAQSLHEVSLIKAKNDARFFKELGNLVNLRKLGLADLKKQTGSELCQSIQKMKNLSKLDVRSAEEEDLDLDQMTQPPVHIQRLRLTGRLQCLPRWISSLPSLVKVVLKKSKLGANQNPMDTLGVLSSLLELEMVECYTGQILKFEANSFKRLKKLHIEQFEQLTEFVLETNALLALEKLTICKCINLRPLPSSFRLNKLTELVVCEMSDDFNSDIGRRVGDFELVMDGVQAAEEASSSSTARGNIDRRIVSRRYLS